MRKLLILVYGIFLVVSSNHSSLTDVEVSKWEEKKKGSENGRTHKDGGNKNNTNHNNKPFYEV